MLRQLQIMTNYPTKYESFRINDLEGVPFTKYSTKTLFKSHNSCKHNLIKMEGYYGQLTHHDQSKAFGPTTTQRSYIHIVKRERTGKQKNNMPPYYHMKNRIKR